MISLEKLNQQQLKKILQNIYTLGYENKNIRIEEIIEEIRREVMTCIFSSSSSN